MRIDIHSRSHNILKESFNGVPLETISNKVPSLKNQNKNKEKETSKLLKGTLNWSAELWKGLTITFITSFMPYRPRMQVVPVWCLRSGLSDRHSGPSVWRWCAWADCCLCLTSQSHTCPPPTDLHDRHTNKLVRKDYRQLINKYCFYLLC